MSTDSKSSSALTRALLFFGILTGPLFFAVAIVQMLTRPGFDIHHNAISQLSLGDLGGIQVASFILTGLCAILCAFGVRRALHGQKGGTWGALLIGTFGIGLIVAGIFPPDPGFGFPPGSPAGMPTTMSGHASGHAAGFFVSMLSAIAGSIIFARRFAALKERGWVGYCIASAIAAPVFIVLTNVLMSWAGVIVALAGAVVFGWATAIAARLRSELSRS
jgi:hypothetical protein